MSDTRYNLRTPRKQRIPDMSNPSTLETIPDVPNTDTSLSSSSNLTNSSSTQAGDLQLILDNLRSLRDLVETTAAKNDRLQTQLDELTRRPRNSPELSPPQQPETIVPDPVVETEIERLRRENSELVSRYASARTPSPDSSRTRYPKVGDPPYFTGKKEDLPGFLAGLRVVFQMQPGLYRTDRQKILHAFSFTKSPVRNALTPAIADDEIWDRTDWTRSFSAFSNYLERNYGDPNVKVTASNKIQALKQTGSAASYFNSFMEYASVLSWTDEIKVAQARRGLDERILELLVVAPDQYDEDFEGFKKQVIRIDERLASNQIERNDRRRRDITPRSHSAPAIPEPGPNRAPYSRSTVSSRPPAPFLTTPTPRKPIPILPGDPPIDWEIENVRTSEKERQWRRDNNRCLVCRSPDHQAIACPSKRERSVGNDRSVRGTIVEEEKE